MSEREQIDRVFQVAVLASLSDGETGPQEADLLERLLDFDPAFDAIADPRALVVAIRKDAERDGVPACTARLAAGIRERATQEMAYRLCVRVIAADGRIDPGESILLADLERAFGFDSTAVNRLLENRQEESE